MLDCFSVVLEIWIANSSSALCLTVVDVQEFIAFLSKEITCLLLHILSGNSFYMDIPSWEFLCFAYIVSLTWKATEGKPLVTHIQGSSLPTKAQETNKLLSSPCVSTCGFLLFLYFTYTVTKIPGQKLMWAHMTPLKPELLV